MAVPVPKYDGFKQTLYGLMKRNESAAPFKLDHATDESGWSYGWVQFDLAAGPNIGKTTFRDILENATWDSAGDGHKKGDKIIPKDQVDNLCKLAAVRGKTEDEEGTITSEQKQLIESALGSEYGQQQISKATSGHLDNLIKYADSVINKVGNRSAGEADKRGMSKPFSMSVD
jgi:hypothetical protein